MADLTYVVSFKGMASPTVRSAFEDCALEPGAGVTVVRCATAELPRIMATIQDLGLQVLDVRLVVDDGV